MSLVVSPPLLWTACTIFPVVCTAIVGARFVARNAQRTRPGWDDWLMVPALILIWGMAIDIMIGTGQGAVGYPTPQADPSVRETNEETIIHKVYFSITLLQIAALAFIKISCMLFLGRIFRTRTGTERVFDIFYWGYIVATVGWFLSFFFAYLFTCGTNVAANWGPIEESSACPANFVQIDSGMSYMDLLLDVFILVFPIPYIWRLNLNFARKVLVTFIFFLGSMAILASIARVVIIELELDAIFLASADQNLTATAVVYFMFLEACFGLSATCLPSLSGLTKFKSVQNMVAGLTSIISSLTSSNSSKKGSSRGAELSGKSNPNDVTSSTSGHSENAISLAPVEGTADTWVSHDRQRDIEMGPQVPQDEIQVERTFATTRETRE